MWLSNGFQGNFLKPKPERKLSSTNSVYVGVEFEGPVIFMSNKLPVKTMGPCPLLIETLSSLKGSNLSIFNSGIPEIISISP